MITLNEIIRDWITRSLSLVMKSGKAQTRSSVVSGLAACCDITIATLREVCR